MAQSTDPRQQPRSSASVRERLGRWVLQPSGAPYAGALAGGLVSAVLTYQYVGAGAHELNPVMRALIATAGIHAMVVLKVTLLVAAYWAYGWLRSELPTRAVSAAAWLGALVHLADAAHDLRVALGAPFTPPVTAADLALFAGVAVAGVLLWPRWRVLRRLERLVGRR
jgi:hypothetical protein